VAKTPKAPVPETTKPATTPAQDERAAVLRKRIQELADGVVPRGGAAPTPREFTDEAARKAYEAQQRKKRSRKGK
jgi:hypothetical protein